ncbi:MAG: V-type ATP synthase subunit E [Candidatus Aminicenantes bacterium]|nr:V-type ATP synthase subunit E [Candidatus Aminicenantes bacterium]
MALDSILTRIQDETSAQARVIVQEARQQAEKLLATGRREADKLFRVTMLAAQNLAAQKKQRELVICRLENRKRVLQTKQEILDALFAKTKSKLKKSQIRKQVVAAQGHTEESESIDFFINALRRDIETELAKLLFS